MSRRLQLEAWSLLCLSLTAPAVARAQSAPGTSATPAPESASPATTTAAVPPDPPAPGPIAQPAPPPPPWAPYPYGYGYDYGSPGAPYSSPSYPAQPVRIKTVPYEGGPVPDGATVKTQRENGWLIAGAVTLAALYGISVIYAIAACPPGDSSQSCPQNTGWLFVPVIGPFLTAASPDASYGGRNLAIFDGVFQTAGAAAAVIALATSEQVLETRERPTAGRRRSTKPRVALSPGAPGALAGATVNLSRF